MKPAKQFIHPIQVKDAYENNVLDNSDAGFDNQYNYDRYEEQRRQNNQCGGLVTAQINNVSASNHRIENHNLKRGVTTIYKEEIVQKAAAIEPLLPTPRYPTTSVVLREIHAKNSVTTAKPTPAPVAPVPTPVVEPTPPSKVIVRITTYYDDGTYVDEYNQTEKTIALPVPTTVVETHRKDMTWAPRTGSECYHNDVYYKSMQAASRSHKIHRCQVKKNCIRQLDGWRFKGE